MTIGVTPLERWLLCCTPCKYPLAHCGEVANASGAAYTIALWMINDKYGDQSWSTFPYREPPYYVDEIRPYLSRVQDRLFLRIKDSVEAEFSELVKQIKGQE